VSVIKVRNTIPEGFGCYISMTKGSILSKFRSGYSENKFLWRYKDKLFAGNTKDGMIQGKIFVKNLNTSRW
jgi:hypothetical protein